LLLGRARGIDRDTNLPDVDVHRQFATRLDTSDAIGKTTIELASAGAGPHAPGNNQKQYAEDS
jgi:hypothetical protein